MVHRPSTGVDDTLLDPALALARQGVPVFPLGVNKRPMPGTRGFLDATTEPRAIARMFADPAALLIGTPTGAASGFDVLDVDPLGQPWMLDYCFDLGQTRVHRTRRLGFHYLFKHREGVRSSAGRIAEGIDIRGDGGYIVWWPAAGFGLFDDSEIADMPDWLFEKIQAAKAVQAASGPKPPKQPLDLTPPSAAVLIKLLQDMPNPPETSRDIYIAVNLAVQGAIRGGTAVECITEEDADEIKDAAAEWSAKWDSATSSDYQTERDKWESDWSQRENDVSGWSQLLVLAGDLGVDVSAQRAALAADEFSRVPLPPEVPYAPKPVIQIRRGTHAEQVNQAERALMVANRGLYQRGGEIVRAASTQSRTQGGALREVITLVRVNETYLRAEMDRAATWQRWDARAKAKVPSECPPEVARTYLARGGHEWRLPLLVGLAHAPTLRSDGTVIDQPGFDAASGILLDLQGAQFPPVPEQPTRQDAAAALKTLVALVEHFPFVSDADLSVALSAMLTAVARATLPTAPLHAFSANEPGSGKSKLATTAALIATGRAAPAANYSKNEEEVRKSLEAALLAGSAAFSLDNADCEISGSRLCSALTEEVLTVRLLGQSKNVEVHARMFLTATGNGLSVAADMTRRTLVCRLNAGVERPEEREFPFDPVEQVRADRPRYVSAVLTILRAYVVAGMPGRPPRLGSFEAWSDLIRGALIWIGQADPLETMRAARRDDPRRRERAAVMHHVAATIGVGRPVTSRQIIEAAQFVADFRDALLPVAGKAGTLDPTRLGHWLRANRDRMLDGLKLEQAGETRENVALWAVVQA